MLPGNLAHSALESAPDAIIISDASGSIVFANQRVAVLFGYSSEEILGRSVEHLLPERFRARHVIHREGFAHSPRYGLGLSIVSRLVKLLNLKLDVRSQLGEGTCFSLELPASCADTRWNTTASLSRAARPRAAASRRVLLVEDDPAVRDATRMLLKAEGHEVITAASHAEALQKADEQPALDLLISDYHLGSEETGVQVIASVRAKLGIALKAILVTGDTSPAIKGLNPDAHLRLANKPIQAEQLLTLMTNLLADR